MRTLLRILFSTVPPRHRLMYGAVLVMVLVWAGSSVVAALMHAMKWMWVPLWDY